MTSLDTAPREDARRLAFGASRAAATCAWRDATRKACTIFLGDRLREKESDGLSAKLANLYNAILGMPERLSYRISLRGSGQTRKGG
ncbi:hypothetical protein X797_007667 [Metarhizium robertsii]|uniref:Uncharacterized protein n=1 Tax=Metarhizium robertsii TaxID=568076 RepID=A0A014N181_9HYPO|nr:hypothetical protein X797_007667 [Metarhizium robertsii]